MLASAECRNRQGDGKRCEAKTGGDFLPQPGSSRGPAPGAPADLRQFCV